MKPLILDASLALSWLFERKEKKEAKHAESALLAISKRETIVPSLWHTEILNGLLMGERQKIINEAQTIDYLNKLYALPIQTDETKHVHNRDLIMSLAREHRLTSYDATYLDLALRRNGILATFDNKLAKAMQTAGGELWVK